MEAALSRVVEYVNRESPAIVHRRRLLHAMPELAFREVQSAEFVAGALRSCGLHPETGIAGTGLTARLRFARPGPTVLLRADMDALPVCESTGLEYASRNQGRMHACGHDGHMAIMLGVAGALADLAASEAGQALGGSVLFVFQPAEEGQGGAEPMVRSGLMDGVDYCLAGHIWPDLDEGLVGVRTGPIMASVLSFEVVITGKGGHGSQPHLCSDALDAAAQLTCALQHIVSRRIDPMLPAVLTVASLNAGDTHNVIPQTARLSGCARAFQPETMEAFTRHIGQIAQGICASVGVTCEVTCTQDDGPVVNDAFVAEAVARAAGRVAGADRVVEPAMSLAGEDFSRYLHYAPGCMVFLGAGFAGAKPLHSPEFLFHDELVLPQGVKVFCASALELLASGE
ncbi:amidohydrolase [Desulfovibrio sp. OttesenSCG-928-G15]|nr:amidohydrolase [Desulfovibrio sp. OttesenSCG-928-G15]